MANARAVGIDLGTTNSAAAWVDESGRTVMVPNREGDLLTPSVVLFNDAEVVVGKEARTATVVHPDRVAEWVKRDMGSSTYSRAIRGEYLPPEVIQACILRKLKLEIAESLGPVAEVVITVPAYFDESRRKATADAGTMAGLTVLDIVNEPTAAALAFGEIRGYLAPGDRPLEEMTVLVYDLGGGTFDVTLLRLAPGDVRTLATDGDVQLGGHDWDRRLVDHAAESFMAEHGLDPRDDHAGLARLYNAAVEAKHALSARPHATIRVDFRGRSSEIRPTREQFEELTADLLERTAHTVRQLLATAKLKFSDVARVLLVGGSTRMPMVTRMIEDLSGLPPDHTVNPDEAVARGAALYANYLLDKQAEPPTKPAFAVTNVNAHSLGVEGIEQETLRKKNVVLIRRNTPLPARFTERFVIKSAGQRSIAVQVLEGESSLPGECSMIGRTVIRDLPSELPEGWPVDVTFEYGSNGRLSVHATVPGTDREVALQIEREVGLSDDGVSRWTQAVTSSSGFSAFESQVDDLLRRVAPVALEAASPQPSTAAAAPASGPAPLEPAAGPAEVRQPPDAGNEPHAPGSQAPASALGPGPLPEDRPATPSGRGSRRWLINVVGLILSAIVGIVLGYLLISWLVPNHGLPRLW